MHPTTSRRRGRPAGSTGTELLAIARDQFLAQGFRGATMDTIAAQARISKQSLYTAYPSKGELYAAVVRDWVEQGHDALRPYTVALREATDVRAGLRQLATALQAGLLSPPVLQMRALIAAESAQFPEVAADYLARSWDHNLGQLARALAALARRGLLAVEHPAVAAEQFVWLAVGAPLNQLSLRGAEPGYPAQRLRHLADEAVTTFLCRYQAGPHRHGTG